MANVREKAISISAGNLNSGLSYLITTVFQESIWCNVARILESKILAWVFVLSTWIWISYFLTVNVFQNLTKLWLVDQVIFELILNIRALVRILELQVLKPNYFKKQCFSSSVLLTRSRYTGPKLPWSNLQASPMS